MHLFVIWFLTLVVASATTEAATARVDLSCGHIFADFEGLDSAFLHKDDIILVPIFIACPKPIARFELKFAVSGLEFNPILFIPRPELFDQLEATEIRSVSIGTALTVEWSAQSDSLVILGDSNNQQIGMVGIRNECPYKEGCGIVNRTFISSGQVWVANDKDSQSQPAENDSCMLRPDTAIAMGTLVGAPFGPVSSIGFEMPRAQSARLEILDTQDKVICTIANGYIPEGKWKFYWNSRDRDGKALESGRYYYRLSTADSVVEKKSLLLMK